MFSILGLAALIVAIVANSKINDLRRELKRVKRSVDGGAGGASDEVLDELDRLRAELMDVQERLDFTERLLSSEQRKLQGGSGS